MAKREFDKATKHPPPFSIRFSWKQRAELDRLAEGQSWGRYIKDVLFIQKRRPKASSLDRKTLGKLLGALGKSRIASNINQLARAANSGSLPVNEDVTKALMSAVRTIEWMKITLIEGMGLKAHRSDKAQEASPIEDHPNDP